jgi:hypothetical protein
MTVRELIEALVPFKDDDELGVAIVGWSGTHSRGCGAGSCRWSDR